MWWIPLAFAADPIPCCAHPAVRRNVTYYLRLQTALAKPDDSRWSGVLWGWEPIARETAASLPRDDRAVLLEVADALAALKIRSQRGRTVDALPAISRAMTWLVVRHAGGDKALVEGDCDGRPWLQEVGPVASPYGCGGLREP